MVKYCYANPEDLYLGASVKQATPHSHFGNSVYDKIQLISNEL